MNAFGPEAAVQAWMGHADYRTTQRYPHYRERGDEAARLALAFTPHDEIGEIAPAVEQAAA